MKDRAFMLHLPSEIAIEIFTRLSVRTIISCKCVCKKWRELISSAEFANLHFSRSRQCLFIYRKPMNETECEDVEFERALDIRYRDLHYNPLMEFYLRAMVNGDKMDIECTFDGMLCLHHCTKRVDTLYVCNPITREYITLPSLKGNCYSPNMVSYGMGMSASSARYKVVRILFKGAVAKYATSRLTNVTVESMVYTLGTESWKRVKMDEPFIPDGLSQAGAYVNGNLYWLVKDANLNLSILCFDLERELFKSFSSPAPEIFRLDRRLTVFEDYLCYSYYESDGEITLWVIDGYGVKESWQKYVIDGFPNPYRIFHASVYPLKAFDNGDSLLFCPTRCLFFYYNKTRTPREVELFTPDDDVWFNVMLYTPSFVSLKTIALEEVRSF